MTPSVTSSPSRYHWKVKSSVNELSVKSAFTLTIVFVFNNTCLFDGWATISIKGVTVTVATPEDIGSLNALPVLNPGTVTDCTPTT